MNGPRSTQVLRVTWSGGVREFSGSRPVRVGRGHDMDVVMDAEGVSRHHLTIDPGDPWQVVDQASTNGVYRGHKKVATVPLIGDAQVRLGRGTSSPIVRFELLDRQRVIDAGVDEATEEPAAPTPVDAPRRAPDAGPAVIDSVDASNALTVHLESKSFRVPATQGASVRVGAAEGNHLRSSRREVQPYHLELQHDGSSWYIQPLSGAAVLGSDGKPIRRKRLRRPTSLQLGSRLGPTLVLDPGVVGRPGIRDGRRRTVMIAAGAVLLLAAAFLMVWLLRDGPDPRPQPVPGVVPKRSTVLVRNGDRSGLGVVVGDGLVLVAAHVVAPDAPNLWLLHSTDFGRVRPSEPLTGAPATAVAVGEAQTEISTLEDTAALGFRPQYRARLLVVDGYLDLAILRIDATIADTPVQPGSLGDLSPVTIGDDNVSVGEESTALELNDDHLSVRQPVSVSEVAPDERLDAPVPLVVVPGGPDGGLLVKGGLPTALGIGASTRGPVYRPLSLAGPLLAAARSADPYEPVLPVSGPIAPDVIITTSAATATGAVNELTACPPADAVAGEVSTPPASTVGVRFGAESIDHTMAAFPAGLQMVFGIAVQPGAELRWIATRVPMTQPNGMTCGILDVEVPAGAPAPSIDRILTGSAPTPYVVPLRPPTTPEPTSPPLPPPDSSGP